MIVPNAKIIVCGGRYARNRLIVWSVLDSIKQSIGIGLIIEGGQRTRDHDANTGRWVTVGGVDYFAFTWAGARRVPVQTIHANWGKFGKSAGPIRNAEMLTRRPDYVLAFPGGKGTASMVQLAELAGVAVVEAGSLK